MTEPVAFVEPKVINPRLVTKTSLPGAKKALALVFLLWLSEDAPASIAYGSASGDDNALDGELIDSLELYLTGLLASDAPSHNELVAWGNESPLVKSQIESLNAALELIWHLGRVSFEDSSLTVMSERTGGKRYRKVIRFTTNMDVMGSLANSDNVDFAGVMVSWLTGQPNPSLADCESRIVKMLTAFAETSYYKTGKGEQSTVYTPCGVYDAIVDGAGNVELVSAGEEPQGPTRILKTVVKDGLNAYLADAGGSNATLGGSVSPEAMKAYSERARTMLELSRIEVAKQEKSNASPSRLQNPADIGQPRNLIYFGAPGTGKSYQLNLRAVGNPEKHIDGCFDPHNVTRVTFHPDYTYAQFVGCLKPFSKPVIDEDEPPARIQDAPTTIEYEFAMGPFIETYIKAIRHPEQNFLLVVEEINRANPAAVFGDVFQLLDRDESGVSEYPVTTSRDLRWPLFKVWKSILNVANLNRENMYSLQDSEASEKASSLALPGNLYIWATMNSADQGVFPMDTAFKRRWDFRYIDIDAGADVISDYIVPLGETGKRVRWNDLRVGINNVLRRANVNEDKWLGPFFIKLDLLEDNEAFLNAFKDKVLLYLYEDAAKSKPGKVFADKSMTYSEVCKTFMAEGVAVFSEFDEGDIEYLSADEGETLEG